MIKVEDLHKSFDGNRVLAGLSLEIEQGEILALIGRSGYGKSVFLKLLSGLMRPDRGRVIIDGRDIHRLKGKALREIRNRLGFLFQGGALFDSMTIFENVAFPLREKSRLKETDIKARVLKELGHVDLLGAENKFPSQLSGGMMKRAALARELVMEPEILLFDEPTTGLDPIIGNTILNLIDSCRKRLSFTGIIVTHEIRRVFDIVDRVALLHDGVIRAVGSPKEITGSKDPVVQQFITGGAESPIPDETSGPVAMDSYLKPSA
jgi:phospholipid/cholesterol/gamma-HCH transport system ATP-binding protein